MLATQDRGTGEFRAGLEEVHTLMERERYADAHERLMLLLAAHTDQPYARAQRAEIEEDLRRILFWQEYEPPKAQDLVSGKLLKYDERQGDFQIRYGPEQLDDFLSEGDVMVHPVAFTGYYRVEIELTSYPAVPPAFFLDLGNASTYALSFGRESDSRGYYRAQLSSVSGQVNRLLDEQESVPIEAGKPCRLEIRVGDGLITGHANGKRILQGARTGEHGRFGFSAFARGELRRIEIEGQVSPTWMQNLRDAALQEARLEFDRDFQPERHLPAWLLVASGSEAPGEAAGVLLPGSDQSDPGTAWRAVLHMLEEGAREAALSYLQTLSAQDLRPVLRDLLLARVYRDLGKPALALQCCRRVCQADPSFLETRLMEAALLWELDQPDEARGRMESAARDFPASVEAATAHVAALLRAGRMDEARRFVDAAGGDPQRAAAVLDLQRMLAHTDKGPAWTKPYRHQTKHYLVSSDIDLNLCREAGKVLEDSYLAFTRHLRPVPDADQRRFRAYLFSGQDGYLRYSRDALGGAHGGSAGLYSPVFKQLLIWNLPDRDAMFRTIRHEAFHQYLDRLAPDAPIWLNEGLAEYYEIADYVDGQWREGQVHFAYRERLLGSPMLELQHFVALDRGSFYAPADVEQNYAQAWGFVHFLRHGGKAQQQLFDRLFDSLVAGSPARGAVQAQFAGTDFARMQKDLELHLLRMR
ncbi:MAG: DUF1570 domain-containing protein [Planctomycetota bacterium]|nr:MAG: DUF1570 domain-containing protein [Planctomycetota bacterium]